MKSRAGGSPHKWATRAMNEGWREWAARARRVRVGVNGRRAHDE